MLITQTTEFRSVFRSRTIVGIAMVTIVVSSRIMKNPMHSAISAAHGLTRFAIVFPHVVVHNGQVGFRAAGRLVVRPRDPAGLEVPEQPFGPGQLRLAL